MAVETQETSSASGEADPVSIRVVERLADAEGLDPKDLPPLARTVDLEALDSLIESAASDTTVSFSVDGYEVTVDGEGTVSLDPSS
jgi:hypothetical protein